MDVNTAPAEAPRVVTDAPPAEVGSPMTGAPAAPARVLAFATKGGNTNEEQRLRDLLSAFATDWFSFDRTSKLGGFRQLVKLLKSRKYDLAVMEGTGIAGGLALLWSRLWGRCRYVVSSGDAVGPWVGAVRPGLGWLFTKYEKWLCRRAAGFIGWTPYLVGRALTFGCPRAATAAGFALHPKSPADMAAARKKVRADLGIPDDTIVFGIVGSLAWNKRVEFCYGWELVNAIRLTDRKDVAVVVVGDGAGLDHLRRVASTDLGKRIYLTGGVANQYVLDYMAAFDVGSLPQSVDGVGSFRYTTKISEYVAARLPTITGQIPLAYDLDSGWLWRLPGPNPWHPRYVQAVADLMRTITWDDVHAKHAHLPESLPEFDRDAQVKRITGFVQDILNEIPPKRA
ncbi:MAG TPA: glycosyltransferase [Tepidisphaeraceae bacterium]|nr:glycosyltransferase [Tepidisphaeraceae bacterium]